MKNVKVPSDIDRPDTILWGLTLRQVGILSTSCLVAWLVYLSLDGLAPDYVLAAAATVVMGTGAAFCFATPDGVHAERWLVTGIRHALAPRTRVLAPEGAAKPPSWARSPQPVGAFRLPVTRIDSTGVVALAGGRWALICRASPLNLRLRAPVERESLTRGFGRFLNSLDRAVSFIVRSERSDVRGHIARIEEGAAGLPHTDLERAAHAHARYLESLAERQDILRREVYVVFSAQGRAGDAIATELRRRAEDAAVLLRSLGVRVVPCAGEEAAALIAKACEPDRPLPAAGRSLPGDVVTGAIG